MSQQRSPHEDFIMFFIVCFLIGGIAWLIWYFFSVELTNFVRLVRVAEFNLIRFLFGDDTLVYYAGHGNQRVGNWRRLMTDARPQEISVLELKISAKVAMVPLRNIILLIFAVLSVIAMFRGPGTFYKRRMGLEGLMKEQAKSFPTIGPFLKFNPLKQKFRAPGQPVPSQLPIFSEALAPEEWLAYNEVGYNGGQLDVNAAWKALSRQLGARWRGPQKLPLHAQGLYAAFALKHKRKRKESDDLLNEMALAWSPDNGFKPGPKLVSKIRRVIRDPNLGGALKKYTDNHAYEMTALLRALSRAREEGGVMAPAQFNWLRGIDRNLWYPLNNLGRRSYHAEACGAMVHYTNELIAGQKIPTPRLEEVIRGLEIYLKSGVGRTIPELDKKSGGGKNWKK